MASNVLSLSLLSLNKNSNGYPRTTVVNASRFRQFNAGTVTNTTDVYYNKQMGFSDLFVANRSYTNIKSDLSAAFVIRDFEVSALRKNGQTYVKTISLSTPGIVYAISDPSDSDQTILWVENESVAGGVDEYLLDMTLADFVTLVNT